MNHTHTHTLRHTRCEQLPNKADCFHLNAESDFNNRTVHHQYYTVVRSIACAEKDWGLYSPVWNRPRINNTNTTSNNTNFINPFTAMLSIWYNRTGLLGVKHPFIYLLTAMLVAPSLWTWPIKVPNLKPLKDKSKVRGDFWHEFR